MSYDFDYDPESGETPWPMIWSVTPTQYNWEGTLGDSINFNVEAIPDPAYPTAWNDFYSASGGTGGTGGAGGTVTIPPLPPEPILNEYVYESSSTLGVEFVSITVASGLVISDLGTELFFPYENITYFKNNEKKTAQFPQDAIDDDFDYVTALVPSGLEFIVKTSDITAVSTSKSDLFGSFKYKINNDWTKAKLTLESMSVRSKEYFSELVGDDPIPGANPPEGNQGSTGDLPSDIPPDNTDTDEFDEKYDQTYDEFFRNASDEDINTILNDNPNFYDDLKNETKPEATNSNDVEFGTEESPIDKAIREGNIEALMTEYGYTYEEVINLIRGI